MKRIIKRFVPVMLVIMMLSTFVVSASNIEPLSLERVSCNCGGYCYILCDGDHTLEDQTTHKYNFTKTCTKNYYYAHYVGYQCEYCGTIRPMFGVDDTYHLCYIEHEDCGVGRDNWCLDGQLM